MRSDKRRFRPMGITDTLDEVIDLYKNNFALLLSVSAVVYVPIMLIMGLLQRSATSRASWGSILMWIPEAIVSAALAFGISERYLNRETSMARCYRRILNPKLLLPLLGAVFMQSLIIFVPAIPGFVVGVVGATMSGVYGSGSGFGLFSMLVLLTLVWVAFSAVKLLLIEPVIVLESGGVFRSISRSWKLMGGLFWKSLGIYLIVGIVYGIVAGIIVGPMQTSIVNKVMQGQHVPPSDYVLPTILSMILTTFVVPIFAAIRVLIYYDARIRKEGFDLEMLADELDQKTRQFSPGEIASLPQERTEKPSEGEHQ